LPLDALSGIEDFPLLVEWALRGMLLVVALDATDDVRVVGGRLSLPAGSGGRWWRRDRRSSSAAQRVDFV